LTFLKLPGLNATNWRAELAVRFGVILRKVCGGNRTWNLPLGGTVLDVDYDPRPMTAGVPKKVPQTPEMDGVWEF
jgi:hypothetical protein